MSLSQIQEVPTENIIFLVGPPGSGKSTFCRQAILLSLMMDKPIIYVTTELGPSKAMIALREEGLGKIDPGQLNFVDAYNETVGLPTKDRSDTVLADCGSLSSMSIAISKLQEKLGMRGVLLVFDSLTSPYLLSGPEVVRFMRLTLSKFAGEGNSVLACFDEGSSKEEDLVALMSLSDGVIKMEIEKDKQLLNILKHPKTTPTRIEVSVEPERAGIETRTFDPRMLKAFYQALSRGDEAFWRKELGDYVNLFWPILVPWSSMLWDPKRYPTMTYQANKDDGPSAFKDETWVRTTFPWHMRLLMKFLMPKTMSRVKDAKKGFKTVESQFKQERSGIVEYLEDASKTDEHYFRVYENFECWGFKNIGTTMASYIHPILTGGCKGFEFFQGLERDWNAIETKCIGLGDPYCELKMVPGEIDELEDSLVKDVSVIERIHNRLMQRLMGFLLEGKPLVEKRPRLGSDVHLHVVNHTMGGENIPAMGRVWSERYRMGIRMGGAKTGKEIGERLMEAGLTEDEAVNRLLHFFKHCKIGIVTINETIRIKENCENALAKAIPMKREGPSCYYTTGFLNGFFSAVKRQHVKETRCIAIGDPYCEWEFR